ncbi:MAG TPA: hypothetical protein VN238_07720, partial [Solirubrobacteraceae bacterium]|nr:hypothetical protein [Solirubrobacteraceae bacterium]
MSDEPLSPQQPDAAAQPEIAAAEVVPEPAARACTNCGAGLTPEQDWCLECGTAQPGRIGGRPGWRAT